MDSSLELWFDEFKRKLDELGARMDRRWAAMEQRGAAVEPRVGVLKQSGVMELVVADNWGGLSDEIPVLEERVYEPATFDSSSSPAKEEQLADDAHIVADNWGGEFGEPVRAMEERDYKPTASDAASPLPVKEQLAVDAAATEYTSDNHDAPTASATASIPAVPVSVETSPVEYEIQIQEFEKPPTSSSRAAAMEEEALHAILFGDYVGSFGSAFARDIEKKQVMQQEAERSGGFLVPRVKQERHDTIVRADALGASGRVIDVVNPETRGFPLRHSVLAEQFFVANIAAVKNFELHAVAVSDIFATHPSPLRCVRITCCYMDERRASPRFRLGTYEYALHATPLGRYDGSLDDNPEFGFAHHNAPLLRAIGHIGQALAAAAALRADAVGAAGGGLLACVVTAGSAQATCSTVCPAGDRNFADIPVSTLWEEELLRWNDDMYLCDAHARGGSVDLILDHDPVAMAVVKCSSDCLDANINLLAFSHTAKAMPASSPTSIAALQKAYLDPAGIFANSPTTCSGYLTSAQLFEDCSLKTSAMVLLLSTRVQRTSHIVGKLWGWELSAHVPFYMGYTRLGSCVGCIDSGGVNSVGVLWLSRVRCIARQLTPVVAVHVGVDPRPIPWQLFWDSEAEFGSLNAIIRLLVDFELLETRIPRGGSLQLSATVKSEHLVLHYFSPCCILCGSVHLIRPLRLLSQWTSNSLLLLLSGSAEAAPLLPVCFARWMAKSLLMHEETVVGATHIVMEAWFNYNLVSVHVLSKRLATVGLFRMELHWCTTHCIELQPWPLPTILSTNIASELVETISVGSKLNVLDHVTFAAFDLTVLGYDELGLGQRKNQDVRYTDLKIWLDCKMNSMPFCGRQLSSGFVESICPIHTRTYNIMITASIEDWQLQKVISDSHVWCHGRLPVNVKVLQVPWDPGGTKIFYRLGDKPKLEALVAAASGASDLEFGMYPNMDLELALALQISMEDEQARQEAAARQVREESSKTESAGFLVVVWLPIWLCNLLWKPPWQLPALVEFTGVGLDDEGDDDAGEEYEREAEDTILAKSFVQNAATPPTLPKDTGRQLFEEELKKQVTAQFLWDPSGSKLLHRLGGKPNLKKGGMSGITHEWADIWAWALALAWSRIGLER